MSDIDAEMAELERVLLDTSSTEALVRVLRTEPCTLANLTWMQSVLGELAQRYLNGEVQS